MKTIKELLQITLNEGNLNFTNGFSGLCGFINNHLRRRDIITGAEYNQLDNFINTNRPQKGSPHYRISQEFHAYFWKEYAWIPRKKWLIDQIKNIR